MPHLGHRAASMERARAFFNGCALVIDFYFFQISMISMQPYDAADHAMISALNHVCLLE